MNILKLSLDEAGTSETRVFAFDFATKAEIVAGDSLTGSPVVVQAAAPAGAPNLTIGSPLIAQGGKQVQVAISVTGGLPGAAYKLTCRCPTAAGSVLVREGILQVQRP